jgi:hypothetical protein
MLTVSAIAVLLIRDLIHLGENHTMAVFVNGSPFYTLPGTLSMPLLICHPEGSERASDEGSHAALHRSMRSLAGSG